MRTFFKALGLAAALTVFTATGCVEVDTSLGEGFNPQEQLYDEYIAEFDLGRISLQKSDSLSGYSSSRVTIGAYRDDVYGLSTRSCAMTIIPVLDTLDFGENPEVTGFHFSLARDTTWTLDASQEALIQHFRIYDLGDATDEDGKPVHIDSSRYYLGDIKREWFKDCETISIGEPAFAGGDSLSFDFKETYGRKVLDTFLENRNEDGLYIADTTLDVSKIIPGIFITCDEPLGNGGRINMFDLAVDLDDDNQYIEGNYIELKLTSTYEGEAKDTSFIFLAGMIDFPEDSDDVPTQYAFNVSDSEGLYPEGDATDIIYVEGGPGLKPVIPAKEIRALLEEEIASKGLDPQQVIINKAIMEFKVVDGVTYDQIDHFPPELSPTCKLHTTDSSSGMTYAVFANLTDASIDAEDQGELHRSTLIYSPDIAFHAQQILSLEDPDDETYEKYDIWLLTMGTEVTVSESSSSSSTSDYYSQLAYYSYLNSLYGGYGSYGYGSYGYSSYGGYGSSYSNYYSMYYLMSMLSSSSSSSSSSTTSISLDKDRVYDLRLYGPAADNGCAPKLKIVYSASRTPEL